MKKFPDDFIFGAATAAYQAEGNTEADGRGPCYWDAYLKKKNTFDPSIASDFYNTYKEDLQLCHDHNINGIRISISWSRIFPNGTGEINFDGIVHYNRLLDACIAQGVEPFVTLHHFDTPLSLFEDGDWLSQNMIDAYVEFAKVCFKHFGGRVKKWITINEPWSLAAGQYIIGHFPPHYKYDIEKAVQAMHNMMYAHARVVNVFKQLKVAGEIGIIHILEPKFPIHDSPENKKAAKYEHTLCNTFLLDASLRGYYEEETLNIIQEVLALHKGKLQITNEEMKEIKEASKQLDFLGVNYYQSHFMQAYEGESNIHHNGTGEKGTSSYAIKGTGARIHNPEVPTTDWDWSIYPEGLYHMIMEIDQKYKYKKPIYITENGIGVKDIVVNNKIQDQERIDYIHGHLEAILKAIDSGANVKGYFLWSLMDMFSWTNGYNKRYGLFYVDFKTQKRYIKDSAKWYKKIAQEKVLIK